jgi:hypothetical protein
LTIQLANAPSAMGISAAAAISKSDAAEGALNTSNAALARPKTLYLAWVWMAFALNSTMTFSVLARIRYDISYIDYQNLVT